MAGSRRFSVQLGLLEEHPINRRPSELGGRFAQIADDTNLLRRRRQAWAIPDRALARGATSVLVGHERVEVFELDVGGNFPGERPAYDPLGGLQLLWRCTGRSEYMAAGHDLEGKIVHAFGTVLRSTD